MVLFAKLFVIIAIVTTTFAETLNVTNGTRDYVLISQRDLIKETENTQLRIDAFSTRFYEIRAVILYQQEQVLAEINRVNRTLVPQQALSSIKKQCIQKYNKQLMGYQDASYYFEICRMPSIPLQWTMGPQMSIEYSITYITKTLPSSLAVCDGKYSQNQTALEECYIENVESIKTTVHDTLRRGIEQLEYNTFEADDVFRKAVQYSFGVNKKILSDMAVVLRQIENCERDLKNQRRSAAIQNFDR